MRCQLRILDSIVSRVLLIENLIDPIDQHFVIHQELRNIHHLEVFLAFLERLSILPELFMCLQLLHELIVAHLWIVEALKHRVIVKVDALLDLEPLLSQPCLMIVLKNLVLSQTQMLVDIEQLFITVRLIFSNLLGLCLHDFDLVIHDLHYAVEGLESLCFTFYLVVFFIF